MDDVLLVTVDSLRADRLGYHGYDRDTSPVLDALHEEGVAYDAAHAHGPTTFTSFPSILTDEHALASPDYPTLHGTTLAERFTDAGSHTMSVTSNAWVSPTYDYDRGFADVHALGRGPRSATTTWERARHRIGDAVGDGLLFRLLKGVYDRTRETAGDDATEEDRIRDLAVEHVSRPEPTFTWVHYMTTHTPYEPDPETGPHFRETVPDAAERRDLTERAREDPGSLSEHERDLLSDLYDESVRHVDRRIGDLLAAVDRDETVVAVTADHGEEFWDHGGFEHPPQLHQELLHVPLVVLPTGDSPEQETVADPVGLDALGPTLLGLVTDGDTGTEWLPPWGPEYGRVVSACAHPNRFDSAVADPDTLRLAVRADRFKYLRGPDGEDSLYDLSADPGERTDVAADHQERVDELATVATEAAAAFRFGGDGEVPAELEDRLADLGYLQ